MKMSKLLKMLFALTVRAADQQGSFFFPPNAYMQFADGMVV